MIEKIPFGRTGHLSTRLLFGGAALSQVSQDTADRALDQILEYGINHWIPLPATATQNCVWDVDGSPSQGVFLATKTGMRTYIEARDQIQKSLERLHVDQIDLIQLHYLVDPEQWTIAMGPGGALEAAIEARDKGWVKFIGVTGHDITVATMHTRAVARFDFDSILLPYNYTMSRNPQYMAEFEALVAQCTARNIAVQTIKSISRGACTRAGTHGGTCMSR